MRLALARIASAAALVVAVAGPTRSATLHQEAVCGTPPCTRQELQRYELKVIKRLQQANRLSFEARNRGEDERADRLNRVFQRNFERRRAVQQVIASTPSES